MVITGEVVVAIVVATERCTPVATSTEFKTRIKKLALAKNNFFPLNELIRLHRLINRPKLTPSTSQAPLRFNGTDLTNPPQLSILLIPKKTVAITIGIYSLQTILVACIFQKGNANDD